MYIVYRRYTSTVVFESEFLDDIEEWFNDNDPSRTSYDVDFESLDD